VICVGEVLSWEKITYMKVWPPKYGSPFSGDFEKNLTQYWCTTDERYIDWNMPKKLPDKAIKRRCFNYLKVFFKKFCS
jgi:hypothetical protein